MKTGSSGTKARTKKILKSKPESIESKTQSEFRVKEQRITAICQKVSKSAIYLLVFLLPLFFLPWTTNVLDFNKQALLISLVFISLFSWLFGALSEGKISINLNFFHLPVLIFLIVLAISTAFSAYGYGSFWGWPLNIGASFLTTLGFVLLYYHRQIQ